MNPRTTLAAASALSILLCSPATAISACGFATTECYVMKDGTVLSSSKCEYTSCANSTGGSTSWKLSNGTTLSTLEGSGDDKVGDFVNEKPASVFKRKSPDGNKNLRCYKEASASEDICGVVPDGVY